MKTPPRAPQGDPPHRQDEPLAESPSIRKAQVQLNPPPRPPEKSPAPSIRRLDEPTGRGLFLRLATLFLFAVLITAAIAVFVVLPDWVEKKQPSDPEPQAAALVAEEAVEEEPANDIRLAKNEAEPNAMDEMEEPSPPPPVVRREPSRPRVTASSVRIEEESEPADVEKNFFVETMSAGLQALEQENFESAIAAFEKASSLSPGAPEAADGLARAEAGQRRVVMAESGRKARAAEEAEAWRDAVALYDAVLVLDATVEFAQEGRERALGRAELSERIDSHLGRAERLSDDGVLREAKQVLNRAFATSPAGPQLLKQVADLGALIEAYSTPVRAMIESDELTEITVYRVGRLGTFSSRFLDLRPGTYTVVGSRAGYRDVRRELVIEPGAEPEILSVRCEEKI